MHHVVIISFLTSHVSCSSPDSFQVHFKEVPLKVRVVLVLGRLPVLPTSSTRMATLTAQLCSPEEQRLSAQPNAPIHCLTRNESVALAVSTLSSPVHWSASDLLRSSSPSQAHYHWPLAS